MAQILLHGTLHATIFEAELLSNHRAGGGAPKFIRKELDEILSSAPPPEPNYQLRRTGSAAF